MITKDKAYNLDLARKNATRCAGYLRLAVDGRAYPEDLEEALGAALILERQITALIEELGVVKDIEET